MPSWRKALRRTTGRPLSGSIEDFVVITGFSGAGKSQAMACFEDAGYFCVDNLPPEMILSLADLSFDVRFLPNPHYEPGLRELTGNDQAVIDYVDGSDGMNEFYARLVPLLDYLLPAYVREGKSHLTIGIGCTGGRHRSVVIAEHLARLYGARDDLMVDVVHRDVHRPPRRP